MTNRLVQPPPPPVLQLPAGLAALQLPACRAARPLSAGNAGMAAGGSREAFTEKLLRVTVGPGDGGGKRCYKLQGVPAAEIWDAVCLHLYFE